MYVFYAKTSSNPISSASLTSALNDAELRFAGGTMRTGMPECLTTYWLTVPRRTLRAFPVPREAITMTFAPLSIATWMTEFPRDVPACSIAVLEAPAAWHIFMYLPSNSVPALAPMFAELLLDFVKVSRTMPPQGAIWAGWIMWRMITLSSERIENFRYHFRARSQLVLPSTGRRTVLRGEEVIR